MDGNRFGENGTKQKVFIQVLSDFDTTAIRFLDTC